MHQVVDGAGGDPVDVGFLDHGHEGLLGRPPRFQETREVRALAEFGHLEIDGTSAGLPLPIAIAVTAGLPLRAALAVAGAGERLDFEVYEPLGGKADQLAQEVAVVGVLNCGLQLVHLGVGHAAARRLRVRDRLPCRWSGCSTQP